MIILSDINLLKSIETGKLIRKDDWFDFIDTISFAVFPIALMLYSLIALSQINFDNPKDRTSFIVLLSPIVFLSALYGLYRKLMEDRLSFIETHFGQHKNHEVLCEFLQEFSYDIFQSSKDVITVNEESELSYDGLWSKDITFIICERKIYFNIVRDYPIINPPVLFSHLILKHDLKKYFSKIQ